MIQNSLSPVVKSRISSLSGNTISVENRNLARTGTMSSFEYLTTRAPSGVAAVPGEMELKTAALKRAAAASQLRMDFLRLDVAWFIVSPCVVVLGTSVAIRGKAEKPIRQQDHGGNHGGKHRGTKSKQDFGTKSRESKIHAGSPARISRPFSKPYVSKASFRFWLSYGSLV